MYIMRTQVITHSIKTNSLGRVLFVLFFALFLYSQANSQTLEIGTAQSCPGSIATVSLNISNTTNVGAITLYIDYDTTMVDTIYLANINPLISSAMFNDMTSGVGGPRLGILAISWYASAPGVNFTTAVLADIKMKVLGGSCPLTFSTSCEIADYTAQTINVNYINGNLSVPYNPIFTFQPLPLSINTTDNGFYTITATNYDSIRWQIKQSGEWLDVQNNSVFQGFNNDTLFVNHPTTNLDGVYLRCTVSNICSTTNSDSAVLLIADLSGNNNELSFANIYPNPFSNHISIDFSQSSFIEKINIYQIDGKYVKSIIKKDYVSHLYISNLKELKKGTYFLEIISSPNNDNKLNAIYKLIKN